MKPSNTICKALVYFGKLAIAICRPSVYHLCLQDDKAAGLAGKAVFEVLLFNVAQQSLAIEINA